MMDVIFIPNMEVVGKVTPTASVEEIESEIMLHSASVRFARERGGLLTQSMLDVIEPKLENDKHYVIDTKSVMLMPGMFPSIPGWHCDGVVRQNHVAQPDLRKLDKDMKHWVGLISSNPDGTSNTEFLRESWSIPCEEQRVWGSVNDFLESMPTKTVMAADGDIIEFTQPTLHRATATLNKGWRFFFRLSEYHKPPMNKIRHQVQVYAAPSSGW